MWGGREGRREGGARATPHTVMFLCILAYTSSRVGNPAGSFTLRGVFVDLPRANAATVDVAERTELRSC
jgi:hypothetical protein